ncbi:MAG: protein-L-isoaspartate(D-aspartate) O-methyltransferase [Candidatus Omnitrophica bacterium]|nr:protein-L-isoaspartate(D-aspartate) O-methyltransferase [Candidatus Omnitrophota bacterium]
MTFEAQCERMLEEQLHARGIQDARLLAAFRAVPRHLFVPPTLQEQAYSDRPLPIGSEQTISQPYMVALMTQGLRLTGHERVLEIGSGSGYQTAILAELALEVFSVERLMELMQTAAQRLHSLGHLNVHFTTGDGSLGWPEHAPYDAIVVTAAAPKIPPPLLQQLGNPGVMVLPIGPQTTQALLRVEKRQGTLHQREIASCSFVPLLGEYGWPQTSTT